MVEHEPLENVQRHDLNKTRSAILGHPVAVEDVPVGKLQTLEEIDLACGQGRRAIEQEEHHNSLKRRLKNKRKHGQDTEVEERVRRQREQF